MKEHREFINERLLLWYKDHKRNFPWDLATDPYHIYVSEIILQQTRTEQGLNYYDKIISRFPTVTSMANSDLGELMSLWQGLGYYRRARFMHRCTQYVSETLDGNFPTRSEELIRLPGIGPYTSAAIASFAFNESIAAVDGNLTRVFSRLYMRNFDQRSSDRMALQQLADLHVSTEDSASWNRAMMSVGNKICKPKKPLCLQCPLSEFCTAFLADQVSLYPKSKKHVRKKIRHFHYLLIETADKVLIRKRDEKGIWAGLHEMPLVERKADDFQYVINISEWGLDLSSEVRFLFKETRILSHQKIEIYYYTSDLNPIEFSAHEYFWVEKSEIYKCAFPQSLRIFLNSRGLNEQGN